MGKESTVIHKNHPFNLLRRALSEVEFFDKVYLWVWGTFRIVILFLAFLIIGVFAYRFFADRELNDSRTKVQNADYAYSFVSSRENEVVKLLDNLNNYSAALSSRNSYATIVPYFSELSEGNNIVILIQNDKVNISGSMKKYSLSQLESTIKNYNFLKNVAVTSLEEDSLQVTNSVDVEFRFSLQAEINWDLLDSN